MQILDKNNRLDTYLRQFHGKNLTLISAFASDTDKLFVDLIDQDNSVTLIIGSINAFTSPTFIATCKKLAAKERSFSFSVDFRYENSTHWKVYLIEPDIVVIGSANLTSVGVGLTRDTCIVVRDGTLYSHYLEQVTGLQTKPDVVNSASKNFEGYLEEYEARHRRVQGALQRSQTYNGIEEWLSDDTNQTLPIFVWSEPHTSASRTTAKQAYEDLNTENHWNDIKDFFTFESEDRPCPYEAGSMVLTVRSTGAYSEFYTFDRILEQDGIFYCYVFRKKRYPKPFDIKPLTAGLKLLAEGWTGVSTIGRDEIRQLMVRATS